MVDDNGFNERSIKHGTITGYGYWGCRCDLCREAQRVYMQRVRAKKAITTEGV